MEPGTEDELRVFNFATANDQIVRTIRSLAAVLVYMDNVFYIIYISDVTKEPVVKMYHPVQ